MAKPVVKAHYCKKCDTVAYADNTKEGVVKEFLKCKDTSCGMVRHLEVDNTYGGRVVWITNKKKDPLLEELIPVQWRRDLKVWETPECAV